MPARLAFPYHFSISITGGFALGHCVQKRVFMLYIQHLALKGLNWCPRRSNFPL